MAEPAKAPDDPLYTLFRALMESMGPGPVPAQGAIPPGNWGEGMQVRMRPNEPQPEPMQPPLPPGWTLDSSVGERVNPPFSNEDVFGKAFHQPGAPPPIPTQNPAFRSDREFWQGQEPANNYPLQRPPVPQPNPQFHNMDSFGQILAAAPPPGQEYLATKPKKKAKAKTSKKEE